MLSATLLLATAHDAAFLSRLSPDAAVLIATVGLGLIFFELNRPGRILPGSCGLALALLATASLWQHPLRAAALMAIGLAFGILGMNLWLPVPSWLAGAATTALVLGLLLLTPQTPRITAPVALTCGLSVGLLSTALSRIAFRARRLKAVH